jgi:hypothetical protein
MSLSGCARIVFSISLGETCIPEILSVSCRDGRVNTIQNYNYMRVWRSLPWCGLRNCKQDRSTLI